MSQKIALSALGAPALVLLFCVPALAEDHPYVSALRSLSVNRSLLTKAVSELESLSKQAERDPSEELERRLDDLHYKIRALREDAERLQRSLPDPMKADEFLAEMIERQKALGAADKAERALGDRALDEKVRKIYALHERALSFVAQDLFTEAARVYEEILLLSPDDDEAYLLLGHTCLAAGDYPRAAQAFGNAVHIDPANAREIPRLYENILVENPSDDDAMTQLGYAYLLMGNAEDAKRSFQEALKLNSGNAGARRGLLEIP